MDPKLTSACMIDELCQESTENVGVCWDELEKNGNSQYPDKFLIVLCRGLRELNPKPPSAAYPPLPMGYYSAEKLTLNLA